MIEISLEELKKYYIRRSKIEEVVRFMEKEARLRFVQSPLESQALVLCSEVLKEKILK